MPKTLAEDQFDPVKQLKTIENRIRRRERANWPATAADLEKINRLRLYRHLSDCRTFADYLEGRLGMSRQYGYDHIQALRVQKIIQPAVQIVLPLWFAAGLFGLPAEAQIELAQQYKLQSISREQLRQLVAARKRARGAIEAADEQGLAEVVGAPVWQIEQADAAECLFQDLDLQVCSPPYGCLDLALARELDYVEVADYDDYKQRLMPAWASAMYRAAAPWGRLALVVAIDISRPRRAPLAADWCNALLAAGWHYRTWIHWTEGNISRSVARGTESPAAPNVICPVEAIVIVHKGSTWDIAEHKDRWGPRDLTQEEWINWTMGLWRPTWSIAGQQPAGVGGFPAAYPEEIPRRLIKMYSFPRARVGDFFLGSGTTAKVSIDLGRQFYGTDLSQRWVDYARERARAASRAIAAA